MIDLALTLARRFAPHLVRRLAGPRAGDVAEQVLGLAQTITGATDPADVERRLAEDVEKAHAFRVKAADLDAELEQAYLADRQDARDMRLKLAALGQTDWMMCAVGAIVVLGFVATVLAAFFAELTEQQRYLVFSLAGLLGGMSSQVVSYFFGSSRGSAEKTRLMSGGR
jgi:hypothetical protein